MLVHENGLDKRGFVEWIFSPGMLFNTWDTWWKGQAKRPKPHEGLDLCLYRNQADRIVSLDGITRVPVMFDGVVVKIFNDFLGKSLFIEHRLPDDTDGRFIVIYGHTAPCDNLYVGKTVKQGEIIAAVAGAQSSGANVSPHLHISLAWAAGPLSYDRLDWSTIADRRVLALIDPLHVIAGGYSLMDRPGPLSPAL
jgi:hypothetical protein